MKERVLSVRVDEAEWIKFHNICARKGVTTQEMLYACVKDVLWDEGDGIQRWQPERRAGSREAG